MNAENIIDNDGFIKDGVYEIQIYDSELVLDVESVSMDDGARLIAFERTGGLNQCFRINHLEDGIYAIIAVHSSKAIGIAKTHGREVQTKPYDLRDNSIKWRIEADEDSFYKIENLYCGLVLDLEDENWENETPICAFEHHGGDNQKFKLIPKEIPQEILEDIFSAQEKPKDDFGSMFNLFSGKKHKDGLDSVMDMLKPKKDDGNKNNDALFQMQKMMESMKNQIEELKATQEQQKAAFTADSEKSNKEKEELLEMPIEDLDITVRTFNCLNRADIHTVGDLIIKTEDDIIKIRNLSKTSFDEVIQKLASLGLSLKKETRKSNDSNLVKAELQDEINKCQDHLGALMKKAVNADKRIKIFATVLSVTSVGSVGTTTSISDLNSVDEDGLAAALEPFTNPRRIKLLKILMEEELAANEISQATGLVGGQLYHHLQNLENAGLIEKNYDKYRTVNKEILGALMVAVGNTKIAKEK